MEWLIFYQVMHITFGLRDRAFSILFSRKCLKPYHNNNGTNWGIYGL